MSKVLMLTQENCPKCLALKNYLELGLRNQYAPYIEIIKREEQPDRFKEIVVAHGVMATPVLIYGDHVLADTSPSKVNAFFESVDMK